MSFYVTAQLGRPLWDITADTFADLTTVTFVRAWTTAPGTVVLEFADTLDATTQTAVVSRVGAVNDVQDTLRRQASNALAQCRAYLDNPAPTQADALAQVQLLTQITIRLVRLVLHELDGTS